MIIFLAGLLLQNSTTFLEPGNLDAPVIVFEGMSNLTQEGAGIYGNCIRYRASIDNLSRLQAKDRMRFAQIRCGDERSALLWSIENDMNKLQKPVTKMKTATEFVKQLDDTIFLQISSDH